MRAEVSLNQAAAVAEALRDAIEAQAWSVAEQMGVAGLGVWHEGVEEAMVDGTVRLHRYASALLALDQGWAA